MQESIFTVNGGGGYNLCLLSRVSEPGEDVPPKLRERLAKTWPEGTAQA